MKLFDQKNVVGVFRGFSDSGMEFHADLVLPYRDELQSIPMHGQFVLVQLEHEDEAVLGRITSVAAEGRLVSPIGEDYAIRAVRDDRPIPDELRDQYLKYRVDIRVLGVERLAGDKLIFVPSHRRLPHVGAKVAFCSHEVLAEVANAVSGEADGSGDRVPGVRGVRLRGRRPAGDGAKTGWSPCTRHPAEVPGRAAGVAPELRVRQGRVRQVQPDQAAVLPAVRDRSRAAVRGGPRRGSAPSSSTRTASTSGPTRTAAPGCATCHP